jgi:methionyl-tRNA formyltransferase
VNAQPDLIVVAAFGLILGRSILELPVHGCVNLHASLLPKYRGASPVSAAILCGDLETGVTLMLMERGLDTGPVLAQSSIDITTGDTTESLTDRLARVAGELLLSSLGDVTTGGLKAVPQRGRSSMTRPLVKADGWIDWTLTASEIERHVRAMWVWPRAWTTMRDGTPFQLHRARVSESNELAPAGTVVRDGRRVRIRCGDGWVELELGQFAGGNPLGGAQLASNQAFVNQPVLGQFEEPTVPGPIVEPVD